MDIIKFSGQEIARSYNQCAKLSDLIHSIEADVQRVGRVVCKVKVNGLGLSELDEARLADTAVNEVDEIEIETESVGDLVISSVETMTRMVECLMDEAVHLAEVYRRGSTPEARARFMAVVKNTQVLTEGLVVLKPVFERALCGGDAWRASEDHMIATLRELVEAFELEDWVLLSDVLEYELYTSLDGWRSLLCQLREPEASTLKSPASKDAKT